MIKYIIIKSKVFINKEIITFKTNSNDKSISLVKNIWYFFGKI